MSTVQSEGTITLLETFAVIVAILFIGVLRLKELISIDIVNYIAEAENKPLTGAEKMKWVVESIYKALIPIAKAYFTQKRIQNLAQKLFDYIKDYADSHELRKTK